MAIQEAREMDGYTVSKRDGGGWLYSKQERWMAVLQYARVLDG
jgi:hypothetical protein